MTFNSILYLTTSRYCFEAVQHWLDINSISIICWQSKNVSKRSMFRSNSWWHTVFQWAGQQGLQVSLLPYSSVASYRHYISKDNAKIIAYSMIDGRLDNCNALLYGTSAANIHKLKLEQNSMACAVTNSSRSEHYIKYVLASLHWLPIEYRVSIQTCCNYVYIANNTRTELSVWTDPVSYPSRHLRLQSPIARSGQICVCWKSV